MNPVTTLGNVIKVATPTTATATVNSATSDIRQYFGNLELSQAVGTVSGTTPTLDGKIQDSSDSVGFGLSNASYDHTGGAAERLLTSTGDFAAYTFVSGDTINITAGAGIPAGIYEIATRESDNAITLADDSRLTVDSSADVDTEAWADVSGATFTQVTESDALESIVIAADSSKGFIRYVGTITGTTPSFAMAVSGFGQQQVAG